MFTKEALHYADVQVSDILESHGIPDPYKFGFNEDGKLISEYSNRPIEEIIVQDGFLGRVEFEAFKKIQEQAFMRTSGYILWISPPHREFYPVSKIIISEIIFEGKTRKLLNRAVVTGWDELGSILTAKEFASLSDSNPDIFSSVTQVRLNPIFIDMENEADLLLMLEKVLSPDVYAMIGSRADFRAKELYVNAILSGSRVVFGKKPLSCPTAFRVFSKETFTCPKCEEEIPSGQGITTCPHCGIKKEECGVICV